jgi:hypothetical protein
MPKLTTQHVFPPIPDRRWDWRALFEGDDEATGRHGYGPTEDDAIVDLVTRVGAEQLIADVRALYTQG